MKNKVQDYIIEKSLFSNKDKLILGISGGADSVCLMQLLLELEYQFELAHCNFNLRGEESYQDEDFVKDLASRYELKLHVKHFDTQSYADENKISIQMAARTLRYTWFYDLLDSENAKYIVTAHHANDDIETFFINLVRGSGLKGLLGIKAKKDSIVRPLMEVSRDAIEKFLQKNNILFQEDSSNRSLKYLRNKIRHQLIPLLEEMNPSIQKTILDEIRILEGVSEVYYNQIEQVRKIIIQDQKAIIKIKISDLLALQPLNTYLYELLTPYGFITIDSIEKSLVSQSGKQFLSSTHQLLIDREFIFISEIDIKENELIMIQKATNLLKTPININFSYSDNLKWTDDLNSAQLDFDKLKFPLTLRKWKDGDKFIPLGMITFKKLSDFFIDNKFSLLEKKQQWLLCSGGDIVWIVGKRIDNRYKIQEKTKKVYIAQLLNN